MKCNMDCFNCKYTDCIRDDKQDINDQKATWRRNNQDKVKEIRRRMYLKNKEKEIAYGKEYRAKKGT